MQQLNLSDVAVGPIGGYKLDHLHHLAARFFHLEAIPPQRWLPRYNGHDACAMHRQSPAWSVQCAGSDALRKCMGAWGKRGQ